jgi:hypothetical protein
MMSPQRSMRRAAAWIVTTCAACCAILLPARGVAAPATASTRPVAPASFKNVPGVVIAHSPASSGIYIGSPGICRLADGTYLAKHDEFGPKSSEHVSSITRVYRSIDRGASWSPLAVIDGLSWSSLFEHRGALYFVGATREHGQLVAMRSSDGGATWTKPIDGKSGLIRKGMWHTAAGPVLVHAGRLWRAVEDAEAGGGWGERYRPHMMSIPVDGDLLDAEQWTITPAIPRDGGWLGGKFTVAIEGNAVLTPDGRVCNVLRTNDDDVAGVVFVSADGKRLEIDPAFDRCHFPGASKKFTIRYDEVTRLYWTLSNPVAEKDLGQDPGGTRNTLVLASSPDLREWTVRTVLLHHPDPEKHAFQYVDWVVEGEDLLVVSRTAFDDGLGGARRGHDANFLTFHRFKNFRRLTPADGVAVAPPEKVDLDLGGLRVTGHGFSTTTLRDGERAFSNRDYVWRGVPEPLRGATITRGAGGFRGRIQVEATSPRTIYLATGGAVASRELPGFTRRDDLSFSYTDRKNTPITVFERRLEPGAPLLLPQDRWTGTLLIVAK